MELRQTNLFSIDEHTKHEHNIDVVELNVTLRTGTAYNTDKLSDISELKGLI